MAYSPKSLYQVGREKNIFHVFENEKFPITYGMSLKKHGWMNYASTKSRVFDMQADQNREEFLENCADPVLLYGKHFYPYYAHGCTVRLVGNECLGNGILCCSPVDGSITNTVNLSLFGFNGDCASVYMAGWDDDYRPVIALLHSGREGTRQNIISNAVHQFSALRCSPKYIFIGVGPSIQQCHYPVGEHIAKQFSRYSQYIGASADGYPLDLPGIIRHQAVDVGVPEKNIEISNVCTYCYGGGKTFFSHRRDQKTPVRLSMTYMMIWGG